MKQRNLFASCVDKPQVVCSTFVRSDNLIVRLSNQKKTFLAIHTLCNDSAHALCYSMGSPWLRSCETPYTTDDILTIDHCSETILRIHLSAILIFLSVRNYIITENCTCGFQLRSRYLSSCRWTCHGFYTY